METSTRIIGISTPLKLHSEDFASVSIIASMNFVSPTALALNMDFSLRRSHTDNFTMSTPASSTTNLGNPVASLLNQLANQLSEWRSIIPQELQWNEDEPAGNPPQLPRARSQPLEPNVIDSSGFGSGRFFSDDLDSPPVTYPFAYDIQVALLRTRYYYAKYVSHRPFVYKALHFPNQMSREDAEGAAVCLRVKSKTPSHQICSVLTYYSLVRVGRCCYHPHLAGRD